MSPAFDSRPPTRKNSDNRAILPRAIDGYVLEAKKIEDCFRL